jgi:CDP-paratose 2-epimerase
MKQAGVDQPFDEDKATPPPAVDAKAVPRTNITQESKRRRKKPVLITGGAGFIGANLAHRILSEGRPVLIFDNLSRVGGELNLHWLRDTYRDLVQIEVADVRNAPAVRKAVKQASQVFHLAAQVAVTTSVTEPRHDFDVNIRGTLNLLEAIRATDDPAPLVFTSTNKVYGALNGMKVVRKERRYEPEDGQARGVSEDWQLDFQSPYGCSKGAADQYVVDYTRTFGLPAIVFRMSCIYGPRQFGTEDQGWVAHFLIRALRRQALTLYGDGCQVRDLLFIDDLVEALLLAQKNIGTLAGESFNVGGGPDNAVSLLELIDLIGELSGDKPKVAFDEWRPGDQRYYVSNTEKIRLATGWRPQIGVPEGLGRLYGWLRSSHPREDG